MKSCAIAPLAARISPLTVPSTVVNAIAEMIANGSSPNVLASSGADMLESVGSSAPLVLPTNVTSATVVRLDPYRARSSGTNGLLNATEKPAAFGVKLVTSKPRVVMALLVPVMVGATAFLSVAVIVSLPADNVTEVLQQAAAARVPARVVGETGGNLLRIAVDGRFAVDMPVGDAERVWSSTIERYFAKRVA